MNTQLMKLERSTTLAVSRTHRNRLVVSPPPVMQDLFGGGVRRPVAKEALAFAGPMRTRWSGTLTQAQLLIIGLLPTVY